MKKITTIFLLCTICLAICAYSFNALAAGNEHPDHIKGIAIESEDALSKMTDGGKYYLTADITLSKTLEITGNIELCLNGKLLRYESSEKGSIFYIRKEGSLSVFDCSQSTHGYTTDENGVWILSEGSEDSAQNFLIGGAVIGGTGTKRDYDEVQASYSYGGFAYVDGGSLSVYGGNIVGNRADYGGAVYVTEDGTLEITGGRLCGNLADFRGGAVFVQNGAVIVNDGAVSSNRARRNGGGIDISREGAFKMHGGFVTKNTAGVWGGGVENLGTLELYGGTVGQNTANEDAGGIYNGGSFTMHGGTVRENSAKYGGGVCNDGKMTLHDGNILSNLAHESGGGVYNGDTLTINGGKIASNTATTSGGGIENDGILTMYGGKIGGTDTNDANMAHLGGGVCVYSGTFTMYGGTIEKNTGVDGGGVENEAEFIMKGGVISHNYAATQGGGISNRGTLELSGASQITSNASGTGNGEYHGGGVYWVVGETDSVSLSGSVQISGNSTNGTPANLVIFGKGTVSVIGKLTEASVGLCLLDTNYKEIPGVAVHFQNPSDTDGSSFTSDSEGYKVKIKNEELRLVSKSKTMIAFIFSSLLLIGITLPIAVHIGTKRKQRIR